MDNLRAPHVFMWEYTLDTGRTDVPFDDMLTRYRARCRCGWISARVTSATPARAAELWRRDHYDEIQYQALRERIVGRTYSQEFEAIRSRYAAIVAEQKEYDSNPFGQ